jgi:membrane protein
MSEETDRSHGIKHFFVSRLWEINTDDLKGLHRFFINSLQFVLLILRNFWFDKGFLWGSALSFTTILSMVPFLALLFAILQRFEVHNMVAPLLMEQLSGGSQEVASRILAYINNTNLGTLGAFGLVALLFTVITLLDNIEEAFNLIWNVRAPRPLHRKLFDYLVIIASVPLLIFTAISVTTFLETRSVFQWLMQASYLGDLLLFLLQFLPYLIIWVVLTLVYILLPNITVRIRSAIFGALLAGTLWQVAQWGYIHFQVGVARYNAIYGTMAVLPIFMIWIYVSWLIVLLGVQVVHTHQNIRSLRRELRVGAISYRVRELLSVAIIQDLVAAAVSNRAGLTANQLEESLDLPERILCDLLEDLIAAGFVLETAGEPATYKPAREPESIMLVDLLAAVKEAGGSWKPLRLTEGEADLQKLLAELDALTASRIAGLNIRDTVMQKTG